jgi:hypothetical protein
VAPVLLLIVIGGASLLVRIHVQSALEAAAFDAARVAAHSGGDEAAVRAAVLRQTRMLASDEVWYCAQGSGYGQDVVVTVGYRGSLITTLPWADAPLPDAVAWATGQSDRAFRFGACEDVGAALDVPDGGAVGEAARLGPAVMPGVGTAAWSPGGAP